MSALLPERHPIRDFFIELETVDVTPRSDMASMGHPIFSLSTQPEMRTLRYEHDKTIVEILPSSKGLATIFDKDILIYCISQLMAALNAGREVSRTCRLVAHDLMLVTGRETSGDGYARLREAFERLAGTRITTNMVTGGVEVTTGFGLIEGWQILRATKGGRMMQVSVTLSEWLFRAVMANAVLTLSRDYFRLRKPLERRVYELARKHCGRQPEWRVSVPTLWKKSGSASPQRVFRRMVRDMIAADPLPDYHLAEDPGDMLRVTRRAVVVEEGTPYTPHGPMLRPATLETVRALVPGADVYALVAEWQGVWQRSGRPRLQSPDAAFMGWVKKRG